MMIHEFEELTGFYPTIDLYNAIEAAYYEFNGDKTVFCKDYKSNKDGIAEIIACQVNAARSIADQRAKAETAEQVGKLQAKVRRLQAALEQEQEWKPYEESHNVSQAAYEELVKTVKSGAAHYMDDSEAVSLIAERFGFNPAWIEIIHDMAVEEINRHHQVRRTGEKHDRRPCYCASDYFYICFDIRGRSYEAWNDELLLYRS